MIEGVVVMVVGITVVFAFLGLLVLIMQMSALFFTRFAGRFSDKPGTVETVQSKADDLTEIAVAIAAVKARVDNE